MVLIGKPDLQRDLVNLSYIHVKDLTSKMKVHILIQTICLLYYGNPIN